MNPDSIDTSSEVERVAWIIQNWRDGNAGEDDANDTARWIIRELLAALSPSPVRPKEPPAVPSHWNGVGKYSIAFGFEPGGLNFRIAGHGRRDGTATLYFKDDDLDWDEEGYRLVEIANSELLEIRDKLNEVFPSPVREEALEEAAWDWLDRKFLNVEAGHDPNDRDYGADDMVDAFIAGAALRTGSASAPESAD